MRIYRRGKQQLKSALSRIFEILQDFRSLKDPKLTLNDEIVRNTREIQEIGALFSTFFSASFCGHKKSGATQGIAELRKLRHCQA